MNVISVKKTIGSDKGDRFDLDVSFQFGEELLAVFGPSGAGKSLTMRLAAGLLEPDEGRIVLDDIVFFERSGPKPLSNIPTSKRKIGYVFQQASLFPHLTVGQNVAYGHGGGEPNIRELLERFRLSDLEGRYPSQLSLGQQQRVAIARALAVNPRLLLLDEPFSALDSLVREKLRRDLKKTQRELSIPMIFVTHDLSEALSMADRMLILSDGRVLQSGTPSEIYNHPCSRRVARFVGMKNIFEGRVVGRDAASGLPILASEGLAITLPNHHLQVGQEVVWGIRPENIAVVQENKVLRSVYRDNVCEGTVVGIEPKGALFTLFVKVTEGDYDFEVVLFKQALRALGLSIGEKVRIAFNQDEICILEPASGRRALEVDKTMEEAYLSAGGILHSGNE